MISKVHTESAQQEILNRRLELLRVMENIVHVSFIKVDVHGGGVEEEDDVCCVGQRDVTATFK